MSQQRTSAYVAVDLGAASGRVIVGALAGEHLQLHEAARFTNSTVRLPSGLHWDLTSLWRNIVEGLRGAGAWAAAQGYKLVSVGVDTWGVDFGLIGRSGELLGLPHAYRDEANNAAFERVVQAVGRERLYGVTGIQFMPLNTLYQLAARCAAEPALVSQAERLLFVPDLLHYFLTGRATNEATIASTSQMIDPRSGDWAVELLREAGLPTHLLHPTVAAGTPIGPLLPHVREETGLPPDVQVIAPAAHDTASAVAAIPADGDDWCFLSSGTWSLLGALLPGPRITPAARDVPFTNELGFGGSFRFLKNIAGLWLLQECRREFTRRDDRLSFAQLEAAAADAEPFRTWVACDYPCFATPGAMPAKIAEFARRTGQPEPETIGQFARCCLESLAFTYRATLSELERVLDRRFERIHVVGGGGRNSLLNQMTADATGRTVIVGPIEATATGNILVQACGAGQVRDQDHVRRIVSRSIAPAEFRPQAAAAWNAAFDRFVARTRLAP